MSWNKKPVLLILWMMIALLVSFIPMLQIYGQKYLIDSIQNLLSDEAAISRVSLIISLMMSLNIVSATLSVYQQYIYTNINQEIGYFFRLLFAKKSTSLPMVCFEDPEYYNSYQLAKGSINSSLLDPLSTTLELCKTLITITSILSLITIINWYLPIILILSSLPGIWFLFIAKNQRLKYLVNNREESRMLEYFHMLISSKESAKEIRLFGLGNYLINMWSSLFVKNKKVLMKNQIFESRGAIFGVISTSLSYAIISIFLAFGILKDELTLGDFVAITTASVSLQAQVGVIGAGLSNMWESFFKIDQLFNFIENKKYSDVETSKTLSNNNMDIEEIDLVNLSFSYPGANVDTLKNINLKIKKGEKIAILGGNGSGKSTLVNCLLGLYHPTKGSIYINGELLTSENLPSYRTAISAVFQDYYRYKLSIRQNVAVGDLSKENNEDLIELLLSGVGLFEEVKKMKKGINSLLGKEFTNGFELSGGQWQRLAIARGLINDSKLLIIDEPTSALDPLAEMEIMTRFFELNEDKTTVLITHRLGPVKYADRIIVLDSGVIVEEGNHEQLLMLNGLYSAMYLAQSQWYKEHDSLQSAINF